MREDVPGLNLWEVTFRLLGNLFFVSLLQALVLGVWIYWPAMSADPGDLPAEPRVRFVGVGKGIDAFSPEVAVQQARMDALNQLGKQLRNEMERLMGRSMSWLDIYGEKAWLLGQKGVFYQEEEPMSKVYIGSAAEDPLYYQAAITVRLEVPEALLPHWAQRLRHQLWRRLAGYFFLAGAILAGWLVGLGLMVRLDRFSGGYYRGLIVSLSLIGMTLISGAVCAWWFSSHG
jgi:hypothetical protein